MSKDSKKKPGLMARLFSGSKKMSVSEGPTQAELDRNKKLARMHTVDGSGTKKRTEDDLIAEALGNGVKISGKSEKGSRPRKSSEGQSSKQGGGGARPKKKPPLRREEEVGRKGRKKKSKLNDFSTIQVDTSKELEFPCTPETVLAYHKNKPFLNSSEEWLIVELNEYECLIDSRDVISVIAKCSKFFEVEPDELWAEFFEFVEEVPAYDEVINYDIWQEFRDAKYPV